MKRSDEILQAALPYIDEPQAYRGFIFGADWADNNPHWISVEDELPEVGVTVLTTTQNGTRSVVYYDGSEWRAELPGFVRISVCMAYITHWMPLPKTPKGGER